MALSRLRDYPLSGRLAQDEALYRMGCRLLVIGKYICIYRLIGDDIVIYRVADGRRRTALGWAPFEPVEKRVFRQGNIVAACLPAVDMIKV